MENKFIKLLIDLKKALVELLYPADNKCIICSKIDVYNGICDNCYKKIKFTQNEISVGYYCGILKELILRLKYKRDFQAGEILVQLLAKKINNIDEEYYFTYVPMDDESIRKRGFNQCKYLAEELAYIKGKKVVNTLYKKRKTNEQKTLGREDRFKNVKDVFQVSEREQVKDRNFILIDDVITTGATISECTKVLKESGAKKIIILTVGQSYI